MSENAEVPETQSSTVTSEQYTQRITMQKESSEEARLRAENECLRKELEALRLERVLNDRDRMALKAEGAFWRERTREELKEVFRRGQIRAEHDPKFRAVRELILNSKKALGQEALDQLLREAPDATPFELQGMLNEFGAELRITLVDKEGKGQQYEPGDVTPRWKVKQDQEELRDQILEYIEEIKNTVFEKDWFEEKYPPGSTFPGAGGYLKELREVLRIRARSLAKQVQDLREILQEEAIESESAGEARVDALKLVNQLGGVNAAIESLDAIWRLRIEAPAEVARGVMDDAARDIAEREDKKVTQKKRPRKKVLPMVRRATFHAKVQGEGKKPQKRRKKSTRS